ncbi:MAG TPA: zf-HC2 domain-containing protein [Candidatus Deferrimicrobium sp.]|nr:zf-HC2 domain-containing protein [Candidatus Deferrimicrobium sp.]
MTFAGRTHPDLESYYDRATDRAAIDAHVVECPECQAWLDDIHDRLGHLACSEFVELVTEYLDDAVDAPLRSRIDDHLRLCEGCRNYLGEMQSTLATIGQAGSDIAPPESVRAGLVAAFRAWRRTTREEHISEE